MRDDIPFEELMQRLKTGDPDASRSIFQRFARRLIGLARTHLDGTIQRKVDPEDVVQSVFRSFFTRAAQDDWDLKDWDSLWSLLTVITVRKCGHRIDQFRSLRRDIRREVNAPGNADDSAPGWEAIAREPTADEALRLAETVEKLVLELDERDQPIFLLGLQGFSIEEISGQVQRSERTVYRALERIKDRLRSMCER